MIRTDTYQAVNSDPSAMDALSGAVELVYGLANTDHGDRWRVRSMDHSTAVLTDKELRNPDFVGRMFGNKPYVRTTTALLVTLIMVVEYDDEN